MKAAGTAAAAWAGGVCAGVFGAFLVAYIAGLNSDGNNLGPVIIFGIAAIVLLACSRIEDNEGSLTSKERIARAEYERVAADVARRKAALLAKKDMSGS